MKLGYPRYDALEATTPKEQRHHPLKEKVAAYHHNGEHHREAGQQGVVDGVVRRLGQDGSILGTTDPESYQCGSSDAMSVSEWWVGE